MEATNQNNAGFDSALNTKQSVALKVTDFVLFVIKQIASVVIAIISEFLAPIKLIVVTALVCSLVCVLAIIAIPGGLIYFTYRLLSDSKSVNVEPKTVNGWQVD